MGPFTAISAASEFQHRLEAVISYLYAAEGPEDALLQALLRQLEQMDGRHAGTRECGAGNRSMPPMRPGPAEAARLQAR